MRKKKQQLTEAELKTYLYKLVSKVIEKVKKSDTKDEVIDTLKNIVSKIKGLFPDQKKILIFLFSTTLTLSTLKKADLIGEFGDEKEAIEKADKITDRENISNVADLYDIIDKIYKEREPAKMTKKGTIEDFLDRLAFAESSYKETGSDWNRDRWKVSKGKYIGKYQLGPLALKDIGLSDKLINKFKKNPNVFPERAQDRAVIEWLEKNKSYLKDYIDEYAGKTINGIKITKSGILAAAHLRGHFAVKKFLETNGKVDMEDANGIEVSDYMEKFGGYDLEGV